MTLTMLACIGMVTAAGMFTAGTYYGKTLRGSVHHLIEERDAWKKSSDEYKKMAATHEVTYPVTPQSSRWKRVDEFQYDLTPDQNFKNMRRDLKLLELDRVSIHTDVYVIGSWSRWLSGKRDRYTGDKEMYTEAPNWNFDDSSEYEKFGKLSSTFHGNPDDVVDEFKMFFKNAKWGFWCGGADKNDKGEDIWGWARNGSNAGIRFVIKVDKIGEKDNEPEIIYVEVPVEEPTDELMRRATEEVERYLGPVITIK